MSGRIYTLWRSNVTVLLGSITSHYLGKRVPNEQKNQTLESDGNQAYCFGGIHFLLGLQKYVSYKYYPY